MNTERHYPIAFKFAIVTLMGLAVVVFYSSTSITIRLFSVIEFLATLNGWTASEDDSIEYGDLYLLVDALCLALYFLTLLELNNGSCEYFFLYSFLIFVLYILWNILLEKQNSKLKSTLHKYQICNAVAGIYSLAAFIISKLLSDIVFINYIQYLGMVLWVAVLIVWYYDFYIKNYRRKKEGDLSKRDLEQHRTKRRSKAR